MDKMTDFDYIAYTDGGCIRNPGGKGGYGVVILNCLEKTVREYSAGYRSTTNNRMEIRAAIIALRRIPEGASVLLVSDSQLMLNCLSGGWKRNLNLDLWKILDGEAAKRRIQTKWVRGHNGDLLNERCDALATEAMNRPDLLEDEGYQAETVREEKQAPSKKKDPPREAVSVPEGLEESCRRPEGIRVNPCCAEAIAALSEEPSFRKLSSLRTGGPDGWSRMNRENMAEFFPEALLRFVDGYFPAEAEALSCLRWFGRGLPLRAAIRKTEADLELADRFAKEGRRNN